MILSSFRPVERALFLGYLEEWQGLKGTGKQRNEEGDLVSPKDELIDTIVQHFFESFPERDASQHPAVTGPDNLTLTPEARDKLHNVCLLSSNFSMLNNSISDRSVSGRSSTTPVQQLTLKTERFQSEIRSKRFPSRSSSSSDMLRKSWSDGTPFGPQASLRSCSRHITLLSRRSWRL